MSTPCSVNQTFIANHQKTNGRGVLSKSVDGMLDIEPTVSCGVWHA